MKNLEYIICLLLGCVFLACSTDIKVSKTVNEEVEIFPDYKEVTIPVNIAPLNFMVMNAEGAETGLLIEGAQRKIMVKGPNFEIPQKAWQ